MGPAYRFTRRCAGGLAALVAAVSLAACEPKIPKPEAAAVGSQADSAAALPGVLPHDGASTSAADRPGAVATGAIEAGQAAKGGTGSAAAAPTGGDAAASSPAAAASR